MTTDYLLLLKLTNCFTNLQLYKLHLLSQQFFKRNMTLSEISECLHFNVAKQQLLAAKLNDPKIIDSVAQHLHRQDFLALTDRNYPQRLKEIYDPPVILFFRGNLAQLQQPTLGVVGARNNSEYGLQALRRLLRSLASPINVISGLAQGIDRLAHETALQYHFSTTGVIGNGLDYYYPKQNQSLQERMAKEQLLLSEYDNLWAPKRYYFPQRNRIIAGLSHALLVIEAKEKSGSLITANLALEFNRNVLAVPGSIFSPLSAGANALIAAGAIPVHQSTDIISHLTYYP
ncbi:DNA-processing protein DprA [Agrilactobacillus fermenti]|uniref:DNA-processing protein DprA n=1 Tax=Agrilactobacillus fermenti TaxID=2586909 RepID=UPI001E3D93A5|nr:DNA-processing protein DprA [Agrilactobacillus fermenti]MCD2256555.1 DNA-protecting protein DprA [Agrilactobacillus fermenti]